jgi:hypothetical protein
MITRTAARLIVEREVNRPEPGGRLRRRLHVFDEYTIERPWGWVMFYGALARSPSGEHPRQNPPYLVDRVTGDMEVAGTAWPVEKYIEDYETRLLARRIAPPRPPC